MLRGCAPAAGWEVCRGFDELASGLKAANPAVHTADNHNLLSHVNTRSQPIHVVCMLEYVFCLGYTSSLLWGRHFN